jgi:hypothetical protein
MSSENSSKILYYTDVKVERNGCPLFGAVVRPSLYSSISSAQKRFVSIFARISVWRVEANLLSRVYRAEEVWKFEATLTI